MNKRILISILLFLSSQGALVFSEEGALSHDLKVDYSYSFDKLPAAFFFPTERAHWNGYEVSGQEWLKFDNYLKDRYIDESIEEIKSKEKLAISYISVKDDLIAALDKINRIFALTGKRFPVIAGIYMELYATGILKLNNPGRSFIKEFHGEIINNKSGSVLTLNENDSKAYIGYIDCYKKDDKWLDGNSPPAVDGEGIFSIYSKYVIYPSGKIIFSESYPFGLQYKIIAFKEFYSFADAGGQEAYCYKVIFQPVNK